MPDDDLVRLERGGPWVQRRGPAAPSGDPNSWTPIDRARIAVLKDSSRDELRKALVDLIFWVANQEDK